jgi:hypothetical protein
LDLDLGFSNAVGMLKAVRSSLEFQSNFILNKKLKSISKFEPVSFILLKN